MAVEWKQSVMDAVVAKDVEQLRELLESANTQQSLDFTINEKYSPLSQAIDDRHSRIVELLLSAGANANFVDGYGDETPLMLSVEGRSRNTEIPRLLLNHNVDVNAVSKYQLQALHWAMSFAPDETVTMLLEYGAEIHNPGNKLVGVSPFTLALKLGRPGLVNLFLDHCDKIHVHVPLELLFKTAISLRSEECAVVILRRGYFQVRKSLEFKAGISCFEAAAGCGLRKLMGSMVELNPQFLQEKWLVDERVPFKLEQHPEFVSWLVKCRKQPPSLVKLSRCTVLAHLTTYSMAESMQLPLPKSLKEYLGSNSMESSYEEV